ncbi:MAG: putative oxidoreductase C-terminal domain-containing protein [Candidatus Solibacter sp.]|jgi:predicted dehydrogenase
MSPKNKQHTGGAGGFACILFGTAILLLAAAALTAQTNNMQSKLIIVDPGHFHATLLQKEMYPWVDPRVTVYAQLGPELLDYLNRISLFNSRPDNPTRWVLDIHTSSDPMAEMLRGKAGNIVVFTGRNRGKIDRILAALRAGLNVLADKPWIITSADMPKLEEALALAQRQNLAAYDIMTERYEVTSELQRELVNDLEVFGTLEKGSAQAPAVRARSIHQVMKVVAGTPLRRPPWFFDIGEYGEGLADVGTHVVDLVQWTAFPGRALDYRQDIEVLAGRRWPLKMTREQFTRVTGDVDFPPALAANVHGGVLDYYCNNSVAYTLRGVHVEAEILWNWEASGAPSGPGGDVYEASFRGTKSRVEIRQGAAEHFVPEVYIAGANAEVVAAVEKRVAALQTRWPGLAARKSGADIRMVVPEKFRVGHEAHFGQVANHFFEYVTSPKSLPEWENPYMLAKYFVSTKGVEIGRKE